MVRRLPAGQGYDALVDTYGDMLELGELSERAHRESGARAAELGVDWLYLFGDEVRALADGAIAAVAPGETATSSR